MPEVESAPEFFHTLHKTDKPGIPGESGNTGEHDPGLLNSGAGEYYYPHKKYLLK